ncbi:hypothetical protein GCM10027058_29530 [Microbacterium neimengense]
MSRSYNIEHYFRLTETTPDNVGDLSTGTEALESLDKGYTQALQVQFDDEIRIHGPPAFQIRIRGAAVLAAVRPRLEVFGLLPLNAAFDRISSEIVDAPGDTYSILGREVEYVETRFRDQGY